MSIEVRTIDEELGEMVDTYDRFLTQSTVEKDANGNITFAGRPLRVHRSNTNKLYLIFRSIAGGFAKIREIMLASKYRFDARYCSEDDLESAMFITGEQVIPAKPSIARVICANSSSEENALLAAGTYMFRSVDGQDFLFTVPNDTLIAPFGFEIILFQSAELGSFPVAGEQSASVSRTDGGDVSPMLEWEILENSLSLGRPAETMAGVRERLLTDTTRQDTLRELELALNALPTIAACNLIFNPSGTEERVLESGVTLPPKTLLIVITGTPSIELAETVMAKTVYQTHMTDSTHVVWYFNDLFASGKYPVYYAFHTRTEYYLLLHYSFDPFTMKADDVNAAFTVLLNKFKVTVEYVPEISEPAFYAALAQHNITGVTLKKIYIQVMDTGQLETVATVPVPRMTLPRLADISFVPESEA